MNKLGILLALLIPISGNCTFYNGLDITRNENSANKIKLHRGSDDDFNNAYAFTGYLIGVHDSFAGKDFCPSRPLKIDEIEQMVFTFNNDHPELQPISAAEIIKRALRKQYPCS